MKLRSAFVALCTGAFALAAIADDAHHPDEKAKAPAKPAVAPKPSPKAAPGTAGMGGMQANMKRMQDQMAQIHASSDPKERQRLMGEHMKTMHESMSMMGGMTGGAKAADSRQRMDMMDRRMDMMQMMMQQMMAHEAVEKSPAK